MKNLINLVAVMTLSFFGCKAQTNQTPIKAEDISPLLIGETLPKATLQDADGKTIELETILKLKPTVLVFYRGGWCPYCNMQLSGLVKIEQEILDLGFQIVAISPDDFQNLKNTEEKDSIKYSLYSDKDGKFIKDIGIAFETPTMVKGYITTKGQKGKTSDVIPVPTVMVVDKEGKILFEYINPNYKERLSSEMLLAVLKTIKI
ncbi:peroxiredoxin-like family protein [Flavobacterium chilense]|uniref:thioredoxin-dependent peroxiredoxin n=1 Tax=Flavobacterium chilense TaxID=946677 RepID=A0A1M7MFR1_9FLAO|nr:peroxiredoxin-like family protein [Flavobacterium chilense]SHM89221.1 Peroxiredoxin [Flavobacterium chilense]